MKRIGLLVNPIAGVGGPAGLKGSDREDALERAKALGIEPQSARRTIEVLRKVYQQHADGVVFLCAPGEMGEKEAVQAGFKPRVVGNIGEKTSAFDTERIARQLVDEGIDLLIFAGGDGTARDILRAVGSDTLALGIPAGVKMHSSVFAVHPTAAAQLILRFLSGKVINSRMEEVVDLNEEDYVSGHISTKLYGLMKVPVAPGLLQGMKSGGVGSDTSAVLAISQQLSMQILSDEIYCYAIGAGTTTGELKRAIEGIDAPISLLGVDVYKKGECIIRDANAKDLMELVQSRPVKIVISPIGGQGYLFGRGNQQFTPEFLRAINREDITVICTPGKLSALRQKPFLVDTGDETTDATLRGYIRVLIGFNSEVVYKVI